MKLLTIPEACERLRISRSTLCNLVKRGKLRLVKVGGKSLVTEEALDEVIEVPSAAAVSGDDRWEQYYQDLLRRGIVGPESRQAIVAPAFDDFVPVEAKGRPASELIMEDRGAL